jgi:soluble lytic murein transglycosylase-like protein
MKRAALILSLLAAYGPAAKADCVADAARFHGISVVLLQAIVMQESSGRPDSLNCGNNNKTCDYGLTQTNSIHLERLKKFGAKPEDLFDPCVSAYVGAWILSENFSRLGVTWDAVGAYNAASPDKRARYARSIAAKVEAIKAGTLRPPVFISGAKPELSTPSTGARSLSTFSVEKP